ncbi:LamG-like jellyroll fold domain-containing protein [Sphaerimonospora sp. CA-214678]|uniref:LamG-like jellyroll fold domain-containing protein n=1 Tax=Sphaerimonospora sp. CA-214678 TaxID=3240029 RepID=UPI003D92F4A7
MNIHLSKSGALLRGYRRHTTPVAALVLTSSLVVALPATAAPAPSPVSPSSAPAAADPVEAAKREAKKQNKRIEITAARSETSTTFANPDGKTLHAELHSTPIRVKDKNGAWQPIDTRLVEEGGVIRPRSAKGALELSSGGDTQLIKIKGDKGAATIAAPGKLPKAELAGSTATYRNVYGPGTDLVITATPTGYRQEIVIRQRPAKDLKLRIPVGLPKGLKFGKASGATPSVPDGEGKKFAELPPAMLIDAAAMDNPEKGKTGTAPAALEQMAKGDAVVLIAKADFLADPAVTYPVTVATASDTWIGAGVPADTFVSDSYPSGQSNSSLDRVIAGRSNSGTVTWRGYVRFDFPLELLGGTVLNGDLRLWNHRSHTCSHTDSPGIVARMITTEWTAASLTLNNQPSVTTTGQVGLKGAYDENSCPQGEGELWYSIEQMVQSWMDGTPHRGVQLSSASEAVSQNWRWYRSSEYDGYDTYPYTPRGPVLIVDYEPASELQVVRFYPDEFEAPSGTYEDDKAWFDSGKVYGENPPAQNLTPEQELADAIASGTSVETRFTDSAYYPEVISDEDLVAGIDNPEDYAEDPPGPAPSPNPEPSPRLPDKVLNANPYFETELAPWTATGGIVERSTDRAHETTGAASAKVTAPQGDAETVVRSEGDLPVVPDLYHSADGWFYPTVDTDVQYGIDWFDSAGTLLSSSVSNHALTADTWSQLTVQEFPPDGATKAQLRLVIPARSSDLVTVYADEMTLLGPTVAPTPTPTPSPPPAGGPGLVAAYGMEETSGATVQDASGHNNTGVASNTTRVSSGKFGNALSFNGTSSLVTVNDAPSLRLSTALTLSAWVRPTTVSNWRTIVMKDPADDYAPPSYGLYASDGSAAAGWLIREDEEVAAPTGTTPLPINTWSHVALTYDGTTARLYVNGNQVDATPFSGSVYNNGGPLHMGGNSVWGEYFSGLIDEVRIYNLAQTSTQIQTDMNTPVASSSPSPTPTPSPIPTPTPSPSPAPGLVAAYGMEEGAGTVVADASGQNNTGTASDTTWVAGGRHGRALSFNGTSSWVTVNDAPSLRLSTGMTLSAWVKPSTVTDWRTVVLKELVGEQYLSYVLYASDGDAPSGSLGMEDAEQDADVWDDTALPINVWSHLAVTYDGSHLRLYVDGSEVGQVAASGRVDFDGGALHIGGNSMWGEYFKGLIDEVRVYNRAQTQAEIQTDMNAPIGATAPAAAQPLAAAGTGSADTEPVVAKLAVRGSTAVGGEMTTDSVTPQLDVWMSGAQIRQATVEVEVIRKPTKARGKQLVWSGKAAGTARSFRKTFQIPKGKLRDGQKVLWRARAVTPSSTGVWTDWQSLTVGVATAAPMAEAETQAAPLVNTSSRADDIKRLLQTNKGDGPNVKYMSHAECLEHTGTNWEEETEYSKNRFDYCRRLPFRAVHWQGRSKVGEIKGLLWLRMTTMLDSRQYFTLRSHIKIISSEGTIADAPLHHYNVPVDAAAVGSGCPNYDPNGPSGMTGWHRVSEWRASSGTEWQMTGRYTATLMSGPDKEGSCAVTPVLMAKMPKLFGSEAVYSATAEARTVRCDTSGRDTWYKSGGCVIPRGPLALQMARDDIAQNTDKGTMQEFSENYDHIAKALRSPKTTAPGRKTFYDLSPNDKNIPGNWGNFLSRAKYAPDIDANHTRASRTCDIEFGARNGRECDEFPFASTQQGAINAKPTNNWSVQLVDSDHNGAHGAVLQAWYINNRVIRSDKFWIHLLD